MNVFKNWLDYLRIENFSNVKLETGNIDTRFYVNFDSIETKEGVSISLSDINKEIINPKNDRFKQYIKDGEDLNKLYLLFPILKLNIKTDKKNLEYLIPLFYVDITNKKPDLFKNSNINLNVFIKNNEIKSISSSFLNLFKKDIKQIMKDNESLDELICKDFLNKDIRQDTFKKSFDQFKQYLQNNLNPSFKNNLTIDFTNDAIIHYEINNSEFTDSLVDELNLLKNININGSLLDKYIKNESSIIEGDINTDLNTLNDSIWFGSFDPKYPLAKGQACVMQNKSNMIAVQGAPGTGKTTLFLSIIASKIVEKAFKNINGELFNNQILITSTANKAVDNVVERFTKGDEFEGIKDFYFIGGKKELMTKAIERANNYIADLKLQQYDSYKHNQLKNEIIKIKNEFISEETEINNSKKNILMYFKSSNIKEIIQDFDVYKNKFLNNSFNTFDEKNLLETLNYLNNINKTFKIQNMSLKETILELNNIKDNLNIIINSINKMPFYKFEFFGKPRQKLIESFLSFNNLKINEEINLLNIELFNMKLNKLIESLPKNNLEEYNIKYEELNIEKIKNLILEKKFIKLIKNDIQSLSFLENYNYNYGDYFRKTKVAKNYDLYQKCLEYNRLTILQNKDRVIKHLTYWLENVLGNEKVLKSNIPNLNEFFNDISLVYPILTTTLSSSNNFFKKFMYQFYDKQNNNVIVNFIDNNKPLNLVLSDESGMTPLHAISTLMYKAENAIIVGDPVQIEPVIALKDEDKLEYQNLYIDDKEFSKYDVTKVTAYHRSAGCLTGNTFDIGDGIILDEHRRCQKDIADMFVKVAKYKGMSIETERAKTREEIELELSNTNDEKKKESLNKSLKDACAFEKYYNVNNIAINVIGNTDDEKNVNQEEINEIENVLKELEEAGYNLKTDVGIITPYGNQEKALINKFRNKLNHTYDRASIGTVHKFQGVEFKVVIFSTVLTESMDATFINSKPNLINVAISRAKNKFILVGNLTKLNKCGFYLKEMCKHIEQTGLILESKSTQIEVKEDDSNNIIITNNNSIIDNYEIKDEILFTFDHINKFEELINNAKESITIIAPWIHYSDKDNKKSIQYNIIEKAKDKGVDIKIVAGYFSGDKNEEGNSEELLKKYKDLLNNNLFFKIKEGSKVLHTHEKILLIDNKILIIGSFNWLSHDYYKAYENHKKYGNNNKFLVRRETSILTTNKDIIEKLNDSIKDFVF